ncbi:MAG TPA: diguanylate cyclase [Xanthobacteraceae bacterium]|nr:diguanylate cyclase [Xanthobacteraceae bacterium]
MADTALGSVDDDIAASVIDALTSQICVVDADGIIIEMNRAWKQFSAENSGGKTFDYLGSNYLNICEHAVGPAADEAPHVANGLRAVLSGRQKVFQIEYPCHSPTEMRWFLARMSPLQIGSPYTEARKIGAVISHVDITDRKLIELECARLAATDPLTGIPNRRFFDAFASLQMERFLRFGGPLCLMIVDLDYFKAVNDAHGHLAGDEVLRRIAALGKSVIRRCDLFARHGGEEFVCLLPGTDEFGTLQAAERLRKSIEALQIVAGAAAVSVTASIGIASIACGETSMDGVFRRADAALYQAKAAGRNCVRTWSSAA